MVLTHITSLNKVTSNKLILLVRRDFNVVRSNDGLILVGVVEADGVIEVRNVYGGDVVAEGEGEVGKLAVVGDIGVDGDGVLCLFTEGDELLGNTLFAIGVVAEGVDDPDYATVSL
jgi:hypothetical protein